MLQQNDSEDCSHSSLFILFDVNSFFVVVLVRIYLKKIKNLSLMKETRLYIYMVLD
jgi:hypothetical protein